MNAPFAATDITGLPGAELIRNGLEDIAADRHTIPACLAWIAQPRLAAHALVPPSSPAAPEEPELLLYALLKKGGTPDAYTQYNALLRTVCSFERALDHRGRKILMQRIERSENGHG